MQHQRLPIDRPDYQHLQPPAVVELDEHGAHATEVRSRYDGMVRIVVTPTWAKLIDVETTLPTGVEELVRQRAERQAAPEIAYSLDGQRVAAVACRRP